MTENKFKNIYTLDEFENPKEYPLNKIPFIMDIEVTNHCNLECKMCHHQLMRRKKGFMSFELFKKIIDEASEKGVKGIRFIRAGEPFLHPQIFEMIEYTKKKDILVHITTNGLLLNKPKIQRIIYSNLDTIIFSFQGLDKEEYELMRDNDQYNLLMNNILLLTKMKKDNLHVQVTTTTLDETSEEIEKFKEKWLKIVDSVSTWYTSLEKVQHLDRVKPLLLRHKRKVRKLLKNKKGCNEVLTKMSINWNGDVTACCTDFDNQLLVGNLNNQTIEKVWNSERLNKIRNILKNGEFDKLSLCKTCNCRFLIK